MESSVGTTAGFKFFILVLFLSKSLREFGSSAQLLPDEEVDALRSIASKLQYNGWSTVAGNSCSPGRGLNQIISVDDRGLIRFGSNVTCNCNSTVCHVTKIQIKRLNVTGVLPEEFANLTFLQELDLSRNYINGTIPASFGRLRLTILSLLGNRLSGPIPREIGDISTLEELILEDNSLGGPLPQNLGRLTRLRRFLVSGNNFTGTIPVSFGNLTNLEDFRIDGSTLSGRIPDFIGNWTRLTKLYLQGTSMEGPIPTTISLLTNLTELRISDLAGSTSMRFPNLQGMTKMERLSLRNCLLTGPIPDYIGQMSAMKNLDLSFNRLNSIPNTIQTLLNITTMFLNNNSLSGDIPGWIFGSRQSRQKIDLSYNNFMRIFSQQGCQSSNLNLVSALSSSAATNRDAWCLTDQLTCSRNPNSHSLFINCGGPRSDFEGTEYEDDSTNQQSYFFSNSERWAYSTNGVFLGNDDAPFTARAENVTGGDIYRTARFSPSSLRYYGLCLRQGSYKVRLHFAEISYSDDMTFSSLGRRYFDISVQGVLIRKDFNIMEEANGVGRDVVIDVNEVMVNGSTLEIHLYWAGKGTTAIPERSVYGPLISAITITPNYPVPQDGQGNGHGVSGGIVAGIVVGAVCSIILILGVLWWWGCFRRRYTMDLELTGVTCSFTLRQIKAATNNFDVANKIGEGGFGSVYKGVLPDGTLIAVKQLSSKSRQGNREFLNELGMISALQHPHLVKLHGCCIEGNQLLLAYEYMENNSLARALFEGPEEWQLELDWPTRYRICIGVARGMSFLHEESRLKIVHRDIKATNVLLDKDLNAKISDFGLAKLDEEDSTHISTRIAGTYGYMAPEYALRGYLTDKADVYSYGIVLLEIVSGMANTVDRTKENQFVLLDRAVSLKNEGNLMELVDPRLGTDYNVQEMMVVINLALLCTSISPANRPAMSAVVSMLEGRIVPEEIAAEQSISVTEMVHVKMMKQLVDMNESGNEEMSIPYTDSTTSGADLYPVDGLSEYLQKRDGDEKKLLS